MLFFIICKLLVLNRYYAKLINLWFARYKSWVDKFSPSTQQIAINDGNTCMGSLAVHRIQHKLNMLHSNMFPLLGDCGTGIVKENVRFCDKSYLRLLLSNFLYLFRNVKTQMVLIIRPIIQVLYLIILYTLIRYVIFIWGRRKELTGLFI